ncbi:LysR substrate-binding domain-containing protein [Pelagibacterium lacus]|uniref:LysR family transcriptional regulator n=1 Tax=Pelagibacterium lacus TaxID=2282655 RepID=A0A369W2L4_9HYPH|nr:LysR substrate-binding domain-containing protein [Pelagibacterium lacus]RDE08603.1 LysR family transcriptional regulator [Pelagibacterium lacus]
MDLPRRAIPSMAGLLAFEATARYLSFSRAAEDLCLSQGAVSKRVRKLEQVVGVPLLARTRHQVHLTETGEAYLSRVRHLLAELEATTHAVRSEAKGREAIVLAAPLSFSLRWLMPRLRRYRDAHPGLRIDVVTAAENATLEPDSGIDCLVHQGRRQGSDALHLPLFDIDWIAVASPAYRDRHAVRSLSDIGRLVRIEQSDLPGLWQAWLGQSGIELFDNTHSPRVEGLELAIGAAVAGNGIALAPRALVEAELAAHELAAVFEGCEFRDKGYQLSIPIRLAGDRMVSGFADWMSREALAGARTIRAA